MLVGLEGVDDWNKIFEINDHTSGSSKGQFEVIANHDCHLDLQKTVLSLIFKVCF